MELTVRTHLPGFYTPREIAQELGISESYVYSMLKSGTFGPKRGTRWLVAAEDVRAEKAVDAARKREKTVGRPRKESRVKPS